MEFVVYILRSKRDGILYIGHTNNITRKPRTTQ
ncbi:MAG: GIY-YIG nuclease family protein [Phycisphaerae bacterium]|nr:GIY-YIG nuclease family protein [Phycisphaerae bacterium]